MKTFFVLAAMFGFATSSFAANCATVFGTKATVTANGNKLYIRFSKFYDSATLTANGQSRSNYYYRSNGGDLLAIVNKPVLNGGAGKVIYSWGLNSSHGDDRGSVTLRCN